MRRGATNRVEVRRTAGARAPRAIAPSGSACRRAASSCDVRTPRRRRSSLNSRVQPRRLRARADRAARCRPSPADQADRDRLRRQVEAGVHGAQRARASASRRSTTEMLRSDAPCAIARTLTPARAERAEQLRRDARGAGHAVADHREDAAVARRRRRAGSAPGASSRSKASRTDRGGASASACASAKQIECSELPCEISTTEMPCSRSAPNRRCAVPGTPIMPAPSTLISATLVDARDPLDRCDDAGVRADERARLLRRERVADPDRDPPARPPAPSSADESPSRRSRRAPSPRCRTARR